MGERKVLNKYYPPDFDPSKIPRRKQPKNKQMTVRMMLPMSIRCNTCGNYIYKGTKFNSRKEDAVGENYLGIQIVRFYFKCTKCSAELTMKTDPKNSDYTVEAGASRNFEPWRNKDEELDKEKRKRDAEEMGDAMKSLENRTLDSKREMDIMSALDEMKSMKSRHATISVDEMLKALQRTGEDEEEDPYLEQKLDEADEALIKSIFHAPKEFVKRIDDDDEWDDDDDFSKDKSAEDSVKRQKISGDVRAPTDILATGDSNVGTKNSDSLSSKPIIKPPMITFKVKKKQDEKQICVKKDESKQEVPENTVGSNVLGSLAHYDSSEDDD
ncbi:splicing factor YJU2 [Silene latifolia]|uniref:splicing factor YJU2 n=1 Tax=Silene latifolia TaxID=37657 RepID=UPI003D777B80